MAAWTWVVGGTPPSGLEQRELTKARGRTVTWRVDGPATAQFTIDGRSEEAAEVVELETDLTIYRDGVKVFRGRIGPSQDDIGHSTHVAQFAATDYRGMLAYRIVGIAGKVFVATSQATIPWTLIGDSQALSGGNWGITNGVGSASAVTRDRTIDPGKPVAEVINEIAHLDNGFEWEIDAELALNRWYPQRGSATNVVLDYGGVVARVARQLDPKDFANSVLVTGAQGLTPVATDTGTIGADPRGRWESSAGYPTIIEQATLNARSPWLLDETSTLRPTHTVTLRPDRWSGMSHIGLGDTVVLAVNSGRLVINDAHRVVEISVQPGDAGTETVTFGLVAA
jgi:hypothetical protein